MIVIPDVHGRTFWKDAVEAREPGEIVIFLGDYLDPYPVEGISKEDAFEEFKELLSYIREHTEDTVALLGNHDCMTYLSPEMGSCRTDFLRADHIGKLFKENLDLFKVAWISEGHVFSHSAPLKKWTLQNSWFFKDPEDIESVVRDLNMSLEKGDPGLWKVLDSVSGYRGGYQNVGSIVWADLREVPMDEQEWPGYRMVFGHTQLREKPVHTDYWDCLDVRRGFRIIDNTITELYE